MLHFQKTTKLMSLEVFFLFRNLEKRNGQMPMKTEKIKVKKIISVICYRHLRIICQKLCLKSVQIRSFFLVRNSDCMIQIQEIRTRKIAYMNTFHAVKNIETCELQEEFGNGIINILLKLWKYESYHKLINQNKHCTENQVFHWWFL